MNSEHSKAFASDLYFHACASPTAAGGLDERKTVTLRHRGKRCVRCVRCFAYVAQCLLSLYLVDASCAQWKIGGGSFDEVVDQNFRLFFTFPYFSICIFNKKPIFYSPYFSLGNLHPQQNFPLFFIPLYFFKSAPLAKISRYFLLSSIF